MKTITFRINYYDHNDLYYLNITAIKVMSSETKHEDVLLALINVCVKLHSHSILQKYHYDIHVPLTNET